MSSRSPLFRTAALLAGYAILVTGNGLLGTLVSLRLAPPGFGPFAAGTVQSGYYAGFMLGALLAGRVIGRLGPLRAFALFALLVAAACLGHASSQALPFWFVLRFASGACLAGIFSVVESQLHGAASNRVRGRVFAIYMMTTYLGMAGGQMLLGLADIDGPWLFGLVALLFSAALLPMPLAREGTARAAPPAFSPGRWFDVGPLLAVFRAHPLGLCGCAASGMLNSAFYALVPVFLKAGEHTVGQIASTLSLALLAALLMQWPAGLLSDRMPRQRVLLLVCLVVTALSLALMAGPPGARWLVCAYAGVAFTIYSLSATMVNDKVAPALRLPAGASLLLMFSLGGCLGPLLASLLLASFGAGGLFGFSLCVVLPLALLAARTPRGSDR